MKRKTVIVLLAAATMMGALAGCGGDTEETATTQTETAADDGSEAEDMEIEDPELDGTEADEADAEETDGMEEDAESFSEETEEASEIPDPVIEETTVYPATLPEDYSAVTYTQAEEVDVEAQAEAQIQSDLELSREEIEVTDRAAEEGDTVSVDFTGSIDGETDDSMTSQDEVLVIGEGDFLEDFEAALVGQEPGTEFDVNITFPDDYWQEDVAGAEAEFKVTINYILEYGDVPELTDEWVQENTDYETVDEYRAAVEESVREEQSFTDSFSREGELIDSLVALSSVDIPDEDVDAELENYMSDIEATATANGYEDAETYLDEVYAMTLEDYETETRDSIIASLTRNSVVEALIEKEGIEVTQEGFIAYLTDEIAPSYGYGDFDEFKTEMSQYGMLEYFDEMYKEHLVANFLLDKATAVEDTSSDVYSIDISDAEDGEIELEVDEADSEAAVDEETDAETNAVEAETDAATEEGAAQTEAATEAEEVSTEEITLEEGDTIELSGTDIE